MYRLTLLICCGLVACSAPSAPPAGTTWRSNSVDPWREEQGWFELVPSIQTPRFEDRRDTTSIYIQMPPGSQIHLAVPGNRNSLLAPDGAVLDRVERFRIGDHERIVDVRGTRFLAGDEEFHAYRPQSDSAPRLFGIAWLRSQGLPDAMRDAMHSAMLDGGGLVGVGAARRPASIERYQRLLACAGCHAPNQAERLGGIAQWPRRRTDARGVYSLEATLEDSTIVETYRPHDPNLSSPFVARTCIEEGPDGCLAERATLDVSRGRTERDPHVLRVCAARRALSAYLDEDVRAAFRAELAECL